ncbi:Putative flippase GtrA [Stackebrandtia soli]
MVRIVNWLPPRWRGLAAEVTKFGLIGVVNTVISFGLFNLFRPIGSLKANVIAAVVAITCSYFMNRYWTYRDLPAASLRREYSLFFLFNLVGLGIELVILFVADYVLGFDRHADPLELNLAKALGLVLGTGFRFYAYRTFVFGKTGAAPEQAAAVPSSAPATDVPVGERREASPRGPEVSVVPDDLVVAPENSATRSTQPAAG